MAGLIKEPLPPIQEQQPEDHRAAEVAEYARAAEEAYAAERQGIEPPPYLTLDALGTSLIAEFEQARMQRRETEDKWIEDLRQYKGVYPPEVLSMIGPQRSKAFVKKTRVKIKTLDARMGDLQFPSNGERNYTIDSTPDPSLDGDDRLKVIAKLKQDGAPVTEEAVLAGIKAFANAAAEKMLRVIDDQLVESRYKKTCREVMHSGHLYGTGILKGPLVERKVRLRSRLKRGKWIQEAESYTVPFVESVPIWRFFPDMSATTLDDCRYVFERHLMTRTALEKLAERRSFRSKTIVNYIRSNPNGLIQTPSAADSTLRQLGERNSVVELQNGQYEVLERWGWLTGEQLKCCGVKVENERLHETFFTNIWLLPNGQIIRSVIQPINGVTWPYHLYYLDKDETNIFGEGLARIMREDQTALNAATRMILDHGAITAGPQVEVNVALLDNNEDVTSQHPFKVWLRNGKEPGVPAVRVINLPSDIQHMQTIANIFENNADETTAIPRYMYGENATTGAAGTASGMSMLMGSASIVIKDLMVAFDEGITRPFIESLYRWNMQFNPDNAIKGDFDVKARGTASMMAKEVRAQQIMQFAAATNNPIDGPLVKRPQLLRQIAEAHDLADAVKTEDEIKQEQSSPEYQQQMQMQQQQMTLNMQLLAGKVADLAADAQAKQAKAAEAMARVELMQQEIVDKAMAAMYSAFQAAGLAVQNPQIAQAGDSLLTAAGWKDRGDVAAAGQDVESGMSSDHGMPTDTSTSPIPSDPNQPQPSVPANNAGMTVGMHAGIETPAVGDGAQ